MVTLTNAPSGTERPSEAYGRERRTRARWAVGGAFFGQGLLVGGWALQIPVLLDRLGVTESIMGLIIVAFGLGSIAAMLAAGPVIDRVGSREMTRWSALATSPFLLLVSLTPNVVTTALVAAVAGAAIGVVDIAMNANAVEVERRYRRPIMSSFHAYWSLGTLFGALVSGPLIAFAGPLVHAVTFTIALAALSLAIWPHLARERVSANASRPSFALPRAPVVWVLGLVCLFAYVPEGASIDWSALYMREEVGTSIALAGFGLAGMQVTMTIMRLVGDRIRERIGAEATLRWGGVVGALGFAIVGLAGLDALAHLSLEGRFALAVLGFVIAGIGVANIVPVAFAAAGNIPGVPPGTALSVIAMHGYAGILLAPSIVGWVGERTGFAIVYVAIAALPFAVALLARAANTKAR